MATAQAEGPGLVSERVAGGILPKVLNTFDMVAIFVAIMASLRFRVTQNVVNAVFLLYGLGMLLMVLAGVVWLVQGHHSYTNFGHLDAAAGGWFYGLNHNPLDLFSGASTWTLYGFVI